MNGLFPWDSDDSHEFRGEAIDSPTGNQLVGFREAMFANSLAPAVVQAASLKSRITADKVRTTLSSLSVAVSAWHGPILHAEPSPVRVYRSPSRETTVKIALFEFLPLAQAKATALQSTFIDACRELVPDVHAVHTNFTTDPDEGTPKLVLIVTTAASVAAVFEAEDRLAHRVAEIASAIPEIEVVFTYRFQTR